MLLNRAIARARLLGLRGRLIRRRAALRERPALILVPPVLGTRLVDARGREVWGSTARALFGPRGAVDGELRSTGVVTGLTLLPGIYAYDVLGGLLRFLQGAGGYVLDEDLFVLDYDWRLGVAHASRELGELIARVRGVGSERVDLIGVSSGGGAVRSYLAFGGRDPLADTSSSRSSGDASPAETTVRRVVFLGTPQRGSFSALDRLVNGVRMLPVGRLHTEHVRFQTVYDFLPHPDEPTFVDESGRPLSIDLYDPAVWRRLGLGPSGAVDDLDARLERARRLHRALDGVGGHPDSIVIAAKHLPTPSRAVVVGGRARLPPCSPEPRDPFVGFTYAPGDGAVSIASAAALPGLSPSRVWSVTPREHHRLPADPEVHMLVLEALLGSDNPAARRERGVVSGAVESLLGE